MKIILILLAILLGMVVYDARAATYDIYPDSVSVGFELPVVLEKEQNFKQVASRYKVGLNRLKSVNPGIRDWYLDDTPVINLPLKYDLPMTREGIVVDTEQLAVFYFPSNSGKVHVWPISAGRPGFRTPKGETLVTRVKKGPTWYPTARMLRADTELKAVVMPGPRNPLGTHAIYFGTGKFSLIRIHGNNKGLVGRDESSGCIRMYNEHVEELFGMVVIRDKVLIL